MDDTKRGARPPTYITPARSREVNDYRLPSGMGGRQRPYDPDFVHFIYREPRREATRSNKANPNFFRGEALLAGSRK